MDLDRKGRKEGKPQGLRGWMGRIELGRFKNRNEDIKKVKANDLGGWGRIESTIH